MSFELENPTVAVDAAVKEQNDAAMAAAKTNDPTNDAIGLVTQYKTEALNDKKQLVQNFRAFKFRDLKPLVGQIEEWQLLLQKITDQGMKLDESFIMNYTIDMLPPSWSGFQNYLEHKTKPMNFKDLIRKLKVEEGSRVIHKAAAGPFREKCFNCQKAGHKSSECKNKPVDKKKRKKRTAAPANMVNDLAEEFIDLSFVVIEVNMVGGNSNYWYMDIDTTCHICTEKSMFSEYSPPNITLYIGNSATTVVIGFDKVPLKMASGKTLTLKDVLHASGMRKNLLSVEAHQWRFQAGDGSKDEAFENFKEYKAEVENHHDKKIKSLRSDRGGEFVHLFKDFCLEHEIVHQLTAPYSPQSNGMTERKNRNLKDMFLAMLLNVGMLQVLTANYILNKVPHKKLDKIPYELWKGKPPSYKYMKVWGA
ncbi:uncharacterized protein [Rutidosis leptorrhynchoides]|uniref:uncharacterized protein n=1 Tax=Rutidosis leptorrhynchoides TaxID=125765 RepID=UPI003A993B53